MAKACELFRWWGNNFRKVSMIPRRGVGRPGPPRFPYSRNPIASIGRARSATEVATPIATIPSRTAPPMIPK